MRRRAGNGRGACWARDLGRLLGGGDACLPGSRVAAGPSGPVELSYGGVCLPWVPRACWAEDTRLPRPRGAMEPGKVGVPRAPARARVPPLFRSTGETSFLPWPELRRELEAEFGSRS